MSLHVILHSSESDMKVDQAATRVLWTTHLQAFLMHVCGFVYASCHWPRELRWAEIYEKNLFMYQIDGSEIKVKDPKYDELRARQKPCQLVADHIITFIVHQ